MCALTVGSSADNVFGNRADCSVSREWWQNKNQLNESQEVFSITSILVCLSGGLELYPLKFLVLTGLSELSVVPLEKSLSALWDQFL